MNLFVLSWTGRKSGKAVNFLLLLPSAQWAAAMVLGSTARVNHTASVPSAPPRIDYRSCQREVSGSEEQRIDSLPAQVKRERNFGHAARRIDGRTPKTLLLGASKWDPSSLRGHACAHAPLPARGEHMSGVMTPIFPRSKGSNTWIEGGAHFGIHRRASSLLSVARVMREEGRHAECFVSPQIRFTPLAIVLLGDKKPPSSR